MPNSLTGERMSIDAMDSVVKRENIELPLLVKLEIILSPPDTLGSLSKYGKKRILNLQLPIMKSSAELQIPTPNPPM